MAQDARTALEQAHRLAYRAGRRVDSQIKTRVSVRQAYESFERCITDLRVEMGKK